MSGSITGVVLAAGTVLTASVPIYDLVHERVLRRRKQQPLEIPENAVVVPGSRPYRSSHYASEHGLSLSCAVILKYRDERTDAATALEEALR